MTYLWIALFSILGAFARYLQTQLLQGWLGRDFPWGTLSINVLGSFLMGLLLMLSIERWNLDPGLRVGILSGGLGAYTTFSTFSLETMLLFERGEWAKALLYISASLLLGIGGTSLGAYLGRQG